MLAAGRVRFLSILPTLMCSTRAQRAEASGNRLTAVQHGRHLVTSSRTSTYKRWSWIRLTTIRSMLALENQLTATAFPVPGYLKAQTAAQHGTNLPRLKTGSM